MIEEKWLDITGFEGLYQVSDLGNVKSVARVVENGKHGLMKVRERILKPGLSGVKGRQYLQVSLSLGGKMHRMKVHQLVACHFVSMDTSMQVDHIDNDKLNNRADNLQRLSARDNCIKAFSLKDREYMTGVSMTKSKSHYKAMIMFKGRNFVLCYTETEEEAGAAYLSAKKSIEILENDCALNVQQMLEGLLK